MHGLSGATSAARQLLLLLSNGPPPGRGTLACPHSVNSSSMPLSNNGPDTGVCGLFLLMCAGGVCTFCLLHVLNCLIAPTHLAQQMKK
jgi:hypothetical protein